LAVTLFPGWLEFAGAQIDKFARATALNCKRTRSIAAIHDQIAAGLDVITDGDRQGGFQPSPSMAVEGIELENAPPRRFGPRRTINEQKHRVFGNFPPAWTRVVAEYDGCGGSRRPPDPESQRARPTR